MKIEVLILSQLGAFITYYLSQKEHFGAIRASASLSILCYFTCYALDLDANLYSIIFFGGTFVGMSAPKRFGKYTIIFSAFLFALMFSFLVPLLNGHGGALGVSSFLAICIAHILRPITLRFKFAKS